MRIGALAGMVALVRGIKPARKCPRCGLHHPLKADKCPHCSELDEGGLELLKRRIEQQHQANAEVGKLLLLVAGVLAALLLVFFS